MCNSVRVREAWPGVALQERSHDKLHVRKRTRGFDSTHSHTIGTVFQPEASNFARLGLRPPTWASEAWQDPPSARTSGSATR
eukprot:10617283-Alexandrium_andersonii.AAC.1